MAVRELRVCDVCETDYTEDNPGWMIMSVPNAPEEMGPVEYDFCSFNCLHDFVTSPDEDEVVSHEETEDDQRHAQYGTIGVDGGMAHPELQNPSITRQRRADVEVPEYVRKAAETPLPRANGAPTLMDAIANGLKPDARR